MTNYTTYEYKAGGTYALLPNIDYALKQLTPGEFMVYAALARRSYDAQHPGRSFASLHSLAAATGYTREQISRTTSALAKKGFIVKTPRLNDDGFKIGNYYQIIQIQPPAPAKHEEDILTDLELSIGKEFSSELGY